MTCPCQNCPERRLVCHDHCPTYLEYHEERLAIREARRHETTLFLYMRDQYFARERSIKAKRPGR